MNNDEIRLKTRKQLLFVQCFPLFWSPVFPCFACTVNMWLGSCCSVGENSCKSWQEVAKNTRVSLLHCFTVSLFNCFTVSLFLLTTCSIVFYLMDHSVTVFPSCIWAIFCALAHYSARTYCSFPLFACPIIFTTDFVGSRVLCRVVQGFGDPLIFSVFPQSKQCLAETRKRQQNVSFCKIDEQVELS